MHHKVIRNIAGLTPSVDRQFQSEVLPPPFGALPKPERYRLSVSVFLCSPLFIAAKYPVSITLKPEVQLLSSQR